LGTQYFVVLDINPEDRLPAIGLYFSCKFIALEAQRSAK